MSRLTYSELAKMKAGAVIDKQVSRYWGEKNGDAQQYRLTVDVWRIRNGMKPMVWR